MFESEEEHHQTATKANHSDFEQRRLSALAEYQILDTAEEAAFDEITELASFICDTPVAIINIIDGHRQWFKSVKGLPVREVPLDNSIYCLAVLRPKLFIIPDSLFDICPTSTSVFPDNLELRFCAGAPLIDRDKFSLGALCVLDHQPRRLSERQLFALEALSNQVMTQLELKRSLRQTKALIERLEEAKEDLARRVSTDYLTGLFNRRAFEHRLTQELALMKRGAPQATLLMMDLDFFKDINDRFGHQAGDQVLKGFASLCEEVFRKTDVVARWGGEEFVVLMPRTTPKQAHQAAQRLHQRLADKHITVAEGASLMVTFSAGLCVVDECSDPDRSLDRVDKLLYNAKGQGRDTIACECCESSAVTGRV